MLPSRAVSLGLGALDALKAVEGPLRRHVLPDHFHRVEIETNSRCNRGCGYCPVAVDPRPPYEMPESVFVDLLGQVAEMGFRGRFSPHFFGEPLLDPRLPRLCGLVRERLPGATVVIYTNGDALTPDKARALLDAGVSLFIVTFEDGESRAFRETRAALPRLTLLRRFVVRHFDRDVTRPFNRGGTVRFVREMRHTTCHAPAANIVIDAWGRLKLCANDYYGEEDWADLTKHRLRDVWARPEYVALRRALLRGDFQKPICRTCAGLGEHRPPLADHRSAARPAAG